ncbi:MAG TPA: DUF2066 domain-containing protein [Gammaproteobacteria bacterium]|nr:DUF2066 domain-containing protein [Gammaproteobacteria bacterium]
MMRVLRPAVFLLCLVALTPAAAVEVQGLYEAEVEQAERTEQARRQAVRAALERVLVKVTGHAALDESLQPLVKGAERYVQRFRFQAVEEPEAGTSEAEDLPAGRLQVRFDREAILEALRQRGQPVWPATRPRTAVWLAVEDGGGRRLVGGNGNDPWGAALRAQAGARGLPVAVPLMDLEDRSRVEPADIWGGFRGVIEDASERYGAQAILVGRAFRTGGGTWRARWALYQGNSDLRWEARGATPEAVAAAGIDGAAEALAKRFAQVYGAGTTGGMTLEVTGVTDLAAYRRIIDYLGGIDGVAGVRVLSVSPDRLRCRLDLEVAARNIVQTIGLGTVLEEAGTAETEAAPPPEGAAVARRYRLSP